MAAISACHLVLEYLFSAGIIPSEKVQLHSVRFAPKSIRTLLDKLGTKILDSVLLEIIYRHPDHLEEIKNKGIKISDFVQISALSKDRNIFRHFLENDIPICDEKFSDSLSLGCQLYFFCWIFDVLYCTAISINSSQLYFFSWILDISNCIASSLDSSQL